jgi:hypothetical protein
MNEEFKIQDFVDKASEAAIRSTGRFSSDQATDFVRIFIQMLYDRHVIEVTDDSMKTAYSALYACELFKILFMKAYDAQSQRLEAIEKLNKTFDI